jgi:hypothetical protein
MAALNSTSGQRQSGDLVALLRNVRDPEDPDEVRGVLAALFQQLPVALQKKKLEEVLYKEDLCYVSVLAKATTEMMRSVGMSVGAAEHVCDVMFEPHVVKQISQVDEEAVVPRQSAGRVMMRAFPALERTGYPGVSGWRTYAPAMWSAAPLSDVTISLMKSVMKDPTETFPMAWVRGGAQDRAIHQAMVNQGAGSMPEELVQALDESDYADQAGLAEFWHITKRVLTVSDKAVGAKQMEFTDVLPVEEHLKFELALRVQQWKSSRKWLSDRDCPQSRVQCNLSLDRLVSKLADVKSAMAALDARYVGQETPLAEKLTIAECCAAEYSSLYSGAPRNMAVRLLLGVKTAPSPKSGVRSKEFSKNCITYCKLTAT